VHEDLRAAPAVASGGEPRPVDRRGSLFGILVALFVAGLALRPQLIAIAPLYGRIEAELGTSHLVGGLLTTLPVLCMGICAPTAPILTARLSPERAITVCLVAIGGFGLGRALAPNVAWMLLLTVGVGLGMGVAGAILPAAVKGSLPGRPAFATGVYAAGIQLGAAVTAGVAVPLAVVVSWRGALATISVITLGFAVAWAWATSGRATGRVRRHRLPVRSRFAWLLGGVTFLVAVPYFGLNAWLPEFLVEKGWTDAAAGNAQAIMNVASLVTSLTVPVIIDRIGSRRMYLIGSAVVLGGAVALLVVDPGRTWLWAAVIGLCTGIQFTTVLVLPLDVSRDPQGAAAAAGLILGVGYIGSAAAPSVLGAIRGAAGTFDASMWTLVGCMVVLVLLVLPVSPRRLARGVGAAAEA
jgi:MFS transporter, CP family, cyanate transporter